MTAQKLQRDSNAGISTRRLFKLLANALWDWHWLSHNDKKRFPFLGPGDLLWVPHFYGALGLIDAKNYSTSPRGRSKLFVTPLEIFNSGFFQQFQPKRVEKRSQKTFIVFADYIPLEMVALHNIPHWEERYWRILIETYARVDDKTRDAMASCRNAAATRNSLIVQLLRWRDDLLRYLALVVNGPKDPATDGFAGAETADAQMKVKLDHWANINGYRAAVAQAAAGDELADVLPTTNDPPNAAPYGRQVDTFRRWQPHVESLTRVAQQLRQVLVNQQYDATLLGDRAAALADAASAANLPKICAQLVALERKFLARDAVAIAHTLRHVLQEFSAAIGREAGTELPATPDHFYRSLLRDHYPLPRRHFKRRF